MARSPKSSKGSTKKPEESDQPAEDVTQAEAEEVTTEDENTESVEAAAEQSEVETEAEAELAEAEAETQEASGSVEPATDEEVDRVKLNRTRSLPGTFATNRGFLSRTGDIRWARQPGIHHPVPLHTVHVIYKCRERGVLAIVF